MNFARKRDWRNIIVKNDSSVVIATITIHQDDNLIFGNIITYIHALTDCFDCLSFQHIRRCGNIATRRRARLSPKDHRSSLVRFSFGTITQGPSLVCFSFARSFLHVLSET